MYLDVAHNPPALENLLVALDSVVNFEFTLYAIVCFSSNKDIISSLQILSQKASQIRIILLPHTRLIKMEETVQILQKLKDEEGTHCIQDLEFDGDLEQNFKAILESIDAQANENAVLTVCGSVFIMESVRDVLGIKQQKDFDKLNFQS